MAAAISSDKCGGVSSSPSPTSTRVGHLIAARPLRASGRPMIACCWRRNAAEPGFLGHGTRQVSQCLIPVTARMYQERKLNVGYFGHVTGLCEFDTGTAPRRLFGRLGTRPGVEERELRHPLRSLAHDFERDVAAHGEADERKARRRRCQDTGGDGGHRVVTSVIGDRHRTEPPQRRDLLGVKPCRTVQSGYENDRQAVRQSIDPFSALPRLSEKMKQSV